MATVASIRRSETAVFSSCESAVGEHTTRLARAVGEFVRSHHPMSVRVDVRRGDSADVARLVSALGLAGVAGVTHRRGRWEREP